MSSEKPARFVVPGDMPVQIQGSAHLDRLEPYGEVMLYADRPASPEEKIARVKGAEVILNTRGAVTWPGEALRELPDLRMITTCAIGTDNIDLVTASEMGIVVSNQPGRTAKYVAEHIFGLMFAAAKRAAFQTAELKAGRWTLMPNIFLHGKTLGVIGTGNIGSELARLGSALGMRVLAWTFNPSPERAASLGVEFVPLDDLLRRSDVVSMNVMLTDETRGMVGERELAMMKPGSLLLNGGRGDLVDKQALLDSLNSGHLGGAALDVYDAEPLPPGDPILYCQQVVLTPHLADQTPEGIEALNEGAVDNVIAFLEGRPQNVVTWPVEKT
ncbi:MAG: NAD(P)-dependent oxidoreductase [SAR202 cluster bacterium]|nr:NAD(P)-dependent oxidoreductase [SAR202 cluster bacterium]